MVKVWYEPPPFGPGTSHSRPPYGSLNEATPKWVQTITRMPRLPVIAGFTVAAGVLAYIPLIGKQLPFTMSPEYQAAQRAYMRYHNMNPIWGESSKKSRAADGH
mmetsp:Transcript_21103/g.29810  ORF Transcript_21103/g.29810 Transcript_21103/m.29810 type:complete len:104 (-) Transcript_21103:244-555(-)